MLKLLGTLDSNSNNYGFPKSYLKGKNLVPFLKVYNVRFLLIICSRSSIDNMFQIIILVMAQKLHFYFCIEIEAFANNRNY